jgi:hypothetical protein
MCAIVVQNKFICIYLCFLCHLWQNGSERSEEHLVNQKKSHFFIRYFSGKPFKFLQFWFILQHFASTLAIHG